MYSAMRLSSPRVPPHLCASKVGNLRRDGGIKVFHYSRSTFAAMVDDINAQPMFEQLVNSVGAIALPLPGAISLHDRRHLNAKKLRSKLFSQEIWMKSGFGLATARHRSQVRFSLMADFISVFWTP